MTVVGVPVPRVDGVEKVTGAARYVHDLELPGMLYGRVLRSPHPHARIRSIDTSPAQAVPGVVAVVTGRDLPVLAGESVHDMPFLAADVVRYVGEPVAAVAADSEAAAEAAVQRIAVSYEPLPGVFDPLTAAGSGAPLVHEDVAAYTHLGVVHPVAGTNVVNRSELIHGDVDRGLAESDLVVEGTYTSHTVHHVPVEPHGSIAQWDDDGRITVWTANDGPHRLRIELGGALGVPPEAIRVIVPYLGGGFGGKGGVKTEGIALTLARATGGRPVRVTLTRGEVFAATLVRHAAVVRIRSGVRRDGTLLAREVVAWWDTGAYAEKGPTVVHQATVTSAGPYRIPNLHLVGHCVYTNNPVAGAYRGYGTPQVTWAYETHMDEIAVRLGIDPLELRLRNILREGDLLPAGVPAVSNGLEACLRAVAERLHWGEPAPEGRGVGIACTWKNTKTPSRSEAMVVLGRDGRAEVLTSTVEIGQGAHTVLAQIAADELGLQLDQIDVHHPDTDVTPFDASTTSSRSMFHMGNAVRLAALDARTQLLSNAAEVAERPAGDLAVRDGEIRAVRGAALRLAVTAVLERALPSGAAIVGQGDYEPQLDAPDGAWSAPSVFWMYGAQGAEVEVDRETGRVRVDRFVAAHDVGRAINPATCAAQIEGGVIHGISTALYEEARLSEGRMANPNLHDYRIATTADAPEVEPIIVEAAHPDGPFGAKGVGEPVLTPTAAAIGNALAAASGVRVRDLPLSPERVLDALDAR